MRRTVFLCLAAASLLAPVLLTGCPGPGGVQLAAEIPSDEGAWVHTAPPPAVYETIGIAPGLDYVWIGGHWWWGGARYTWAPGRWERRPFDGARWQGGRWEESNDRWRWHEGGWSH